MSTRTKGEVWIFRTFQVEMVGIFELTSNAIGRPEHENDQTPSLHSLAPVVPIKSDQKFIQTQPLDIGEVRY